ncbi:MAG TPA: helix-turn-helix domain-containing protein [Spirochaetota bacterium]|nr:helix-turn-helix domain-containing protein [Spirochaetota bacterium]HRZ28340.1 helix-turn-helix domain-containing protein [Spirochaetota bacterium]HSA15266.1 helix-turn-helix domain-containing protein [Spirochaetota bacterium]
MTQHVTVPRVFVTTKELSSIISIPEYTIRKLVRTGVFPAYQVLGKGYLFKPDEIIKIINKDRIN